MAFRVFFNSRFYYPVFTVLFLDFGLTLEQFAILNAVWAGTIVLAEVPSGALADILGRRRLLVASAMIMVVEIALISFAPDPGSPGVFACFLVNRVLSGLAEAAASGADEALAYDTLSANSMAHDWGRVLERLMRFQSIGFILAMTLGAALYDPALMTRLGLLSGMFSGITREVTLRLPLYLTLVMAVLALGATLVMTEAQPGSQEDKVGVLQGKQGILQAFSLTFTAGQWIVKTPFVLFVLMFGMLFDGIIRMVITLGSQYYRVIGLPESSFGIIGATVAVLGMFVPRIARTIAEKRTPSLGLWVTSSLTVTGLLGMAMFWPVAGLAPALITFSAMYFTGFLVSFHVNRATSSQRRATVLSFKGLVYNISYGVLGLAYSGLVSAAKQGMEPVSGTILENRVFMHVFSWFPGAFAAGLILLVILYRVMVKSPAQAPGAAGGSDRP
ncbi:MAG: MFS transporter [Pseudomonadota bacterium]